MSAETRLARQWRPLQKTRSFKPPVIETMTRRECLAGLAILGLTSGCGNSYRPPTPVASGMPDAPIAPVKKKGGGSEKPLTTFAPEEFGAVGDGETNDTDAFAAMAALVNAVGGGEIILRPTTYVVGKQTQNPASRYAYAPAAIMEFDGCSKPLRIVGNGARIRCADGLRFGTFDPLTGLPTFHAMPYTGDGELASPYLAMITVQNCTNKVSIENLELDGNLAALIIGGPYGDTGRQIHAYGLRLMNNSYAEAITNVYSHHHALDGLMISGVLDPSFSGLIEKVVCEYNARQGCSVVGGCNYTFADCRFNHTGKADLATSPGAGVDIEAEDKTIRNLRFSNCEFSNNTGVGMGADSGDSSGVTFDNCRFIGTTSWSAWPKKPCFSFSDCQFVGAISNTFADPDPSRATQFARCSFVDDPALTPTGQVYGPSWAIADLGGGDENVLFDSCSFALANQLVLPWTSATTFKDCTMRQSSSRQAYPRGTFTGTNTIDGNVEIGTSKVIGRLTINGQAIPPN